MFGRGKQKQTKKTFFLGSFRAEVFSRKRVPCWHSLGLSLAAVRRVECARRRYGEGKRNARGASEPEPGFERESAREQSRRGRSEKRGAEVLWGGKKNFLHSTLFFFLCRSPRKTNALDAGRGLLSATMEEPPRAADEGAVVVAAAVNGGSEKTVTMTEREATTATKDEEPPSTSTLPMPSSSSSSPPTPQQPSPPLPAPPRRAIKAHRRRGDNAGLHFIFCGGRIAIGAF